MKHRLLFITLLACFSGWGQVTDLIISEYVEGSSSNKYVEIYNGTGATVDLSNYKLRLYANGSATPSEVTLSGLLLNNQAIVYKNSASTIFTGTSTVNASVNFNGDDALAIYKISTNSNVDIFGVIGNLGANNTYQLVPGTVSLGSLPATPFELPFTQDVIVISTLVKFTGIIGTGVTVSVHVHINGAVTPRAWNIAW